MNKYIASFFSLQLINQELTILQDHQSRWPEKKLHTVATVKHRVCRFHQIIWSSHFQCSLWLPRGMLCFGFWSCFHRLRFLCVWAHCPFVSVQSFPLNHTPTHFYSLYTSVSCCTGAQLSVSVWVCVCVFYVQTMCKLRAKLLKQYFKKSCCQTTETGRHNSGYYRL